MEKETKIRPSLLSADFLRLEKDINDLVRLGIEKVHFDVMDGNFVEDISFGEFLFDTINKKYNGKIGLDVHLMVINPLRHLERFYNLGAKEISIHYEAINDMKTIMEFKNLHPDLKLGIAFSPNTAVSLVLPLFSLFDYYLVMSVEPGKGGQSFIPSSLSKIKALSSFREANSLSFEIHVDGGIDNVTGKLCVDSGADVLVTGSYFFKSKDRKETLSLLGGKTI